MAKTNSKIKGSRIERELAKILSERFNQEFRRTPQSGAWATNNKNSAIREDAVEVLAGDIICPVDFKFSVESKGRADFNFWDLISDNENTEIDQWIAQVEADAKIVGKEPLLYVKVNNRKAFVLFHSNLLANSKGKVLIYGDYKIIRFDYFLELPDDFFFEE